jgi:RNA polymerase sigma factor (sigma-70 family)
LRNDESADRDRAITGSPWGEYLLERACRGDRDALEGLFERLSGPLRHWARGRLPRWARRTADTADIVQEALLNTFRRLDRFEPRRHMALRAYIQTAIRNRIRDEIRRARSHGIASALESLEEFASSGNLFESAIEREQQARLRHALEQLGVDDHELIVGRLELGYSYEQLAAATRRPSAHAARMAIRRALLRLGREIAASSGS